MDNFNYEEAFNRNYGILKKEEQEKIKKSRIAIIGCGGVGGTIAILLARSGAEKITLVDPAKYEPADLNRQVCCFTDTLGRNKVDVIKEEILRINPEASIETRMQVSDEELENFISGNDVIIPAADDFALSLLLLREAKRIGIPSVIGYPTGALARVTVFLPSSPEGEECFGLPKGLSYPTLKKITTGAVYRRWGKKFLRIYKEEGEWQENWFNQFIEAKVPFPQIAPVVWATSSLVVLEVLKLVTGRWKPVVAPEHWHLTPSGVKIEKFKPPLGAMKLLESYLKTLFEDKKFEKFGDGA